MYRWSITKTPEDRQSKQNPTSPLHVRQHRSNFHRGRALRALWRRFEELTYRTLAASGRARGAPNCGVDHGEPGRLKCAVHSCE
eukprot:scaffold107379_cov68-Phaeocystis_antarctica.AAC.4